MDDRLRRVDVGAVNREVVLNLTFDNGLLMMDIYTRNLVIWGITIIASAVVLVTGAVIWIEEGIPWLCILGVALVLSASCIGNHLSDLSLKEDADG